VSCDPADVGHAGEADIEDVVHAMPLGMLLEAGICGGRLVDEYCGGERGDVHRGCIIWLERYLCIVRNFWILRSQGGSSASTRNHMPYQYPYRTVSAERYIWTVYGLPYPSTNFVSNIARLVLRRRRRVGMCMNTYLVLSKNIVKFLRCSCSQCPLFPIFWPNPHQQPRHRQD
jgi:hypothetical protein